MRWGIGLFIVSEVLFFFAFFWAYFHSGLAPRLDTGMCWPPTGSLTPDPTGVPLLNTVVLLSSGLAITWSHHSMVLGEHSQAKSALLITIVIGVYFLVVQ